MVRFLQSLRDGGIPAWQRLQAVRTVEAYRNLVLQTDTPSLQNIRQTLSRLADQEKASSTGTGRPGISGCDAGVEAEAVAYRVEPAGDRQAAAGIHGAKAADVRGHVRRGPSSSRVSPVAREGCVFR